MPHRFEKSATTEKQQVIQSRKRSIFVYRKTQISDDIYRYRLFRKFFTLQKTDFFGGTLLVNGDGSTPLS